MLVCIECNVKADHNLKDKTLCVECAKKIDKYMEVNLTLKIIDLLLLKKPVFKHFLINNKFYTISFVNLVLTHLSCEILISFADFSVSNLIIKGERTLEINLRYSSLLAQILGNMVYMSILSICFPLLDRKKLLSAVLFSSFFNYFKILFALWSYREVKYFLIIEILNCAANALALDCYENDVIKVGSSVILSKILSLALVVSGFSIFSDI
jgi:lipid intermediate transporter